jgi:phospholipid transport system substrate-binding protein
MLLLLFLGPFPALAGVPLDTVKNNVNGVLDVLRDPKLQGKAGKKLKEQRIAAAADKLFDFVELSKRTPGLNWNKFATDQRKEFVEPFKTILKDAYVDKITAYTNEQVNFTKEVSLSEDTAGVQSVVVSKDGETPMPPCPSPSSPSSSWGLGLPFSPSLALLLCILLWATS